jgi:hypothetical protein
MTDLNQFVNFQEFLKTLADSGKVEWVKSGIDDGEEHTQYLIWIFEYENSYPYSRFKRRGEGYYQTLWDTTLYQAFFLKLAETLVPAGENPEVQKLHEESENLYEDGHDFFGDGYQSGLRTGKAEALPQTHRLAVKVQIVTAFDQKPLDEAVDECINILSKFL